MTTIEDAQALRADAERKIFKILEDLEIDSGMKVQYVNIDKIYTDQGSATMGPVRVELRL